MNVWVAVPSAREERQSTLPIWKQRGYKVAVFRNPGASPVECADLCIEGEYPGYAVATNTLCAEILANDPECDWIVGGGDDVQPDMQCDPERIARECSGHFAGTFGVMQPTGDKWGADSRQPNYQGSAYIERVAGSAWMGREFCMRMYGGDGPLFAKSCRFPDPTHPEGYRTEPNGYQHMGVDEELQAVAIKMGVFWQRPELIHLHRHWARQGAPMPAFLSEANSPAHWNNYKRMFQFRQDRGFPGHEPIQIAEQAA